MTHTQLSGRPKQEVLMLIMSGTRFHCRSTFTQQLIQGTRNFMLPTAHTCCFLAPQQIICPGDYLPWRLSSSAIILMEAALRNFASYLLR